MIIVNLDVMLAKRKMTKSASRLPTSPSSRLARPKPSALPPLKPSAKNSTASQEISWNTGQMNRNYIRRLSLGEDGR